MGFAFAASLAFACLLPAEILAQSAPAATASPTPAEALPALPVPQAGSAPVISAEELAKIQAYIIKQSQNPVGNVAIVPFQNNVNYGYGPYARTQYNLNIQPVVPIQLTPNLNLIARVITPFVNQPSSAPPAVCASSYGCSSTFGIGDINPQFYIAPKTKPGALIWGAGPQFLFPTGTPSSALSAGKYGIGPAVVGLIMPGNIVTGLLVTQMFSYAGDVTKPNINTLFIQPFFNYNLKSWAIFFGSSGITANWNATPSNRWTVPIGTGITKTFKLGDQPMQLGIFYYGNVVRPVGTAYGTVRFNWSLVFPVKRGQSLP